VIKVEGGEREGEAIIMPKRHRDTSMIFAVTIAFIGIMLFLFGTQLAVYTNTNLNYSALGGFIFLAGLLIYVVTRPTKRRR
jgi:predicted membrane channel-forming protein YqfA (hemolysin III family)